MNGARSYRIAELLGRGSFGSVYLADTVGTGIRRPVAVKVLRPEAAAIPGLLERLRDEARMLSMIRHRAIVRVDDLVELDGHWSVVMEYIEGCDVAALLHDGPLPPRVALAIAEEIANALHVAATQEGPDGRPLRLVHRDVKPGNIRVTAQGEVKLLDFGVARAEFSTREVQGTNAVFGTPTYMAPERFRGEDTHAGDVYALGVTLFEMLAGEPPGQGPMEPERVPPGIKLAPAWRQIRETSLPLRDLVCAMIAPDPGERPPARDCARALARIRGQLGGMTLEDWAERVIPPAVRARRRAEDGRVGTVLVERPSQASLRVGSKPPERRSGGAALIAAAGGAAVVSMGLVALLLVGVGGWWWWSRSAMPTTVDAVAADPAADPASDAKGGAGAGLPVAGGPADSQRGASAGVIAGSDARVEPDAAAAGTASTAAATAGAGATTAAGGPAAGAGATAAATSSTPATGASTKAPASTPAAGTSSTAGAGAASTKAPAAAAAGTTTKAPGPATSASPRTSGAAPAGTVTGARAAPATGIVALEGKAESIILMGRAGVFGAGEVPVGEYTAEVAITAGEPLNVRDVTVSAGRVTTITCDARYCRAVAE